MTNKEYQECLMFCLNYCTQYWNNYPYNCLYRHYPDGHYSADCSNTVKSIVNSQGAFRYEGMDSFVNPNGMTGDCSEWGLISQCTPTSFGKMNDGRVTCLYMEGHIGSGYGEEFTLNGHVYNTIETTGAHGDWNRDGTIATYTDANGNRLNHKGGYSMGKWERVGFFPTSWVDDKVEYNYNDNQDKSRAWYKPIKWALQKGLVLPTKSGNFGIDKKTTRSFLSKVLWRNAGRPSVRTDSPYTDIKTDYATWCYRKGYIKGSNGKFNASKSMTKSDVLLALWKAKGKPTASGKVTFKGCENLEKGSDTYKAILWAQKKKYARGTRLTPTAKCPKRTTIIWFYRMFK